MHLVIDLANQIILPLFKHEKIHSWIIRVQKRIDYVLFISAKWKLSPIFVCDAGYTTEEVQQKWKLRREKELEKCIRRIPYCADTIVCEMIMNRNLSLVFDKSYNADDIVATIANMHPKSIILSRDMDYFRYDSGILNDRIYYISDSKQPTKLILTGLPRESLRTIRMYFPKFARSYNNLCKLVKEGLYIRGNAYPLGEKESQVNLHLLTRKYRQSLYTNDVTEIFPIWNSNKCIVMWEQTCVKPDDLTSITNTTQIVNNMMKKVRRCIDEQHFVTIVLMACELVAYKLETSLLDEFYQYYDSSFS
tara:strand:+ start:3156 stop:4073 length:918 start_codon:yes stop_codon:yes gene_type:complete